MKCVTKECLVLIFSPNLKPKDRTREAYKIKHVECDIKT